MNEDALFADALAINDPVACSAFLDKACAGNAELRRAVEALLAAHAGSNVLDRPPVGAGTCGCADDQSTAERPGSVIGPYKLLQEIGAGGMGVVWMAEQSEPVRRRLALKIIKPGMDSAQV